MSSPEGYFLTWTTYATHPQGHTAGSADHARDGRSARPFPASRDLRDRAARARVEDPFVLSPAARTIVEAAIREHAACKGWPIVALEVRSNHVHLLIRATGTPPETVMNGCKAWATRALGAAGHLEGRDKVWTRHGSTRWINTPASMTQAFRYITLGHQPDHAARRYADRPNNKPRPAGSGSTDAEKRSD